MFNMKIGNQNILATQYVEPKNNLIANKHLQRARQFADKELLLWFENLDKKRKALQEEIYRQEEEAKRQKQILAKRRSIISPAANRICIGSTFIAGLNLDGTVQCVNNNNVRNSSGEWQEVSGW